MKEILDDFNDDFESKSTNAKAALLTFILNIIFIIITASLSSSNPYLSLWGTIKNSFAYVFIIIVALVGMFLGLKSLFIKEPNTFIKWLALLFNGLSLAILLT